jgi:hypothetical protein
LITGVHHESELLGRLVVEIVFARLRVAAGEDDQLALVGGRIDEADLLVAAERPSERAGDLLELGIEIFRLTRG